MILSFFLGIFCFLQDDFSVFATSSTPPVDDIIVISVSGYKTTVTLPSIVVIGNLAYYQNSIVGGSGGAPLPYWQNNTIFYSFDTTCRIHPFTYTDGRYFTVPDGVDHIIFYANIHFSPSSSSGSCGFSLNPISCSGPEGTGVTQAINSDGDAIINVSMDVIPGQVLNLENFSILLNVTEYAQAGSNYDYTYSPSFEFWVKYCSVTCYSGFSAASSSDISKLTQDLTLGYDSSIGDQVSSELDSEMDNYLQVEDSLYDQMHYDVPEFSLMNVDSKSGILLASSFLQSLYVSDSFISNVITFVLTLGLILYIIGWLKKGSG